MFGDLSGENIEVIPIVEENFAFFNNHFWGKAKSMSWATT